MASESDSETTPQPDADARSRATERFIARAAKIGEDSEFKGKLNQARKDWNRDYPTYQVGLLTRNTGDQETFDWSGLPLPPQLARVIKAWHDGSWETRLEDMHRRAMHNREDFNALADKMWEGASKGFDAASKWENRVHRLADEGWPPNTYPNWIGRTFPNPARRFVAACLIWGLDNVQPEEWIEPIPYADLIQSVPFDPTIPGLIPETFGWRQAFNALAKSIEEALAEGTPLTPEAGTQLIDRARRHGEQMELGAATWARQRDPEGFRFVRLRRGMDTSDWRALERAFIQSQIDAYGEAPWADEARRLDAARMSTRQIASKLGVGRSTVGRWLGKSDEGGGHS